MKRLFLLLLLIPSLCVGQSFNRPAKEAIKLPHSVFMQIKEYLEKHEGEPVVPEKFLYYPTFNIQNRAERAFVDGIYFFVNGEHDSGTLLINRKGKVTILPSNTPISVIEAYATFLKKNSLPETTQISYLASITAFLKYRQKDQQELVKSGGLEELK